MKQYKPEDLQQIFNNAGISTLHIEKTELPIIDNSKLKSSGKTNKAATKVEMDVFLFLEKVVWLTEFTNAGGIPTEDFDNFRAKVELLSQNRNEKLKEAIDIIWQKYSPKYSKPSDIKNIKLLGLYVAPKLDESKEATLKARIPTRSKSDIFLWGQDTFEYFNFISNTIRKYSKYEFFSYFNLSLDDVFSTTEIESRKGFSPYPVIKIKKGVLGSKMFIFKITPKLLLEKAYVLRNEGWRSDSFQRMIMPGKLAKIRDYIIKNNDASFANNIIVSLDPSINPEVLEGKEENKINLPLSFGSLCIIDGQHRLLAFTQDFYSATKPAEKENDECLKRMAEEEEIIVTLLTFSGLTKDKLRNQTQLFRDINANQTRVKADFIYNLEEIINPQGAESLGNQILKYLSKKDGGIFKDKFETKWYQKGRIKRSSIVKWGLFELVNLRNKFLFSITPLEIQQSFNNGKIDDYIFYCGDLIDDYFRAVKKVFQKKYKKKTNAIWDFWRKSGFMLLSTSSIVGFLRLYRHFLHDKILEEQQISKYLKEIKRVNFQREKYEFTSSQWAKLEEVMFDDIKKRYKNFGDEGLIKRSKT